MCFELRQAWIQILHQLLTSYVTLGKLLNLLESRYFVRFKTRCVSIWHLQIVELIPASRCSLAPSGCSINSYLMNPHGDRTKVIMFMSRVERQIWAKSSGIHTHQRRLCQETASPTPPRLLPLHPHSQPTGHLLSLWM